MSAEHRMVAQSAKEASVTIGKHMVDCTLEWFRQAIQ